MFRTKGTWPRETALPGVHRRVASGSGGGGAGGVAGVYPSGAAIDVIAARAREQRSQIVFTTARGRDMVFWQSPRTRKQARPDVRLPTARAAGVTELPILIDTRERYAYKFTGQQVTTTKRALACGDYAI